MKLSLTTVLTLAIVGPFIANCESREAYVIADALGWAAKWITTEKGTMRPQLCQGEGIDGRYVFRCDPMAVLVTVFVNSDGRCVVTSVTLQTTASSEMKLGRLKRDHNKELNSGKSGGCAEIPRVTGQFAFYIKPSRTRRSFLLTEASRVEALKYKNRDRHARCKIRTPWVHEGDPFFHVYYECDGELDSVWEFPIVGGVPQEYAHWTFTKARGGLPAGVEHRRRDVSLWYSVE